MAQPQLTVSGYRGIWNETLTPHIAKDYVSAFATILKARGATQLLIGRDARISGGELVPLVAQTLAEFGFDVVIGGLLPTPTVLFLVRDQKFDGAIIITASHNPPEYNGLKFVTKTGMFINEDEVAEIKKLLTEPKSISETKGSITLDEKLGERHVSHIVDHIDRELIKQAKFKVVLDPINSAGSILTPKLLKQLGCEVVVINGTPDGNFAHMPEPLAVNLSGLGEKVREIDATVGFAQDPDADRLVVCDETGKIVLEEYTLSLAIKSVLSKKPGDIVINMSTSSTNEVLAKQVGGKTFRTKVGEANVVTGILSRDARIGGEGGGGVIYPTINPCRDSLTGIALILELLAESKKTVSELISELPRFEMVKDKFVFDGNINTVYEKILELFPTEKQNTLDGLRIDFADGAWVHLRPSNTEPLVRLIGEATTKERIENIVSQIKSCL